MRINREHPLQSPQAHTGTATLLAHDGTLPHFYTGTLAHWWQSGTLLLAHYWHILAHYHCGSTTHQRHTLAHGRVAHLHTTGTCWHTTTGKVFCRVVSGEQCAVFFLQIFGNCAVSSVQCVLQSGGKCVLQSGGKCVGAI